MVNFQLYTSFVSILRVCDIVIVSRALFTGCMSRSARKKIEFDLNPKTERTLLAAGRQARMAAVNNPEGHQQAHECAQQEFEEQLARIE